MVGKRKPKQKATDKKNNAKSLSYEASRRRTFTCVKGQDLDLNPQYGYFTSRNVTLQEFALKNRILRVHLNKCNLKDLTTPKGFRNNANKKQLEHRSPRNNSKRVVETAKRKVPEFRSLKIAKSVSRPKTVKKERKQIAELRKSGNFKSVSNPKTVRKCRKPILEVKTLKSSRKRTPTLKGIETVEKRRKPVSEVGTPGNRRKVNPAPNSTKTVRKGRKPVLDVRTPSNRRKISPAPGGTKTVRKGRESVLEARAPSNRRKISLAPNGTNTVQNSKKPLSKVGTPRNSAKRNSTLNGIKTVLIERTKGGKQEQSLAIHNQLNTKKKIVELGEQVVKHLDKNRNLRKDISDQSKLQTDLGPQQRKRGRPRKTKMPIVQSNSESTLDANLNRLKIKSQVFKEEPKLNYKFQKLVSDVKTMKLPTLEWKIKVIIRENKISAIRFTNKSEIERSVSFEADRDNYDIIIDNEPACLIGSPGILDKPEEIEVLLDIIQNIDKRDPMIKYL